jgi:hypothetical protein
MKTSSTMISDWEREVCNEKAKKEEILGSNGVIKTSSWATSTGIYVVM